MLTQTLQRPIPRDIVHVVAMHIPAVLEGQRGRDGDVEGGEVAGCLVGGFVWLLGGVLVGRVEMVEGVGRGEDGSGARVVTYPPYMERSVGEPYQGD